MNPLDNSILSSNKQNISASKRELSDLPSLYVVFAHRTRKSMNLKKVKYLPWTLCVSCCPEASKMSKPVDEYTGSGLS